MINDDREVARLKNLLEELHSFSGHEKLEFLANGKRGRAQKIRIEKENIPLIIPMPLCEEALELLHKIKATTQQLNQQLTDTKIDIEPELQHSKRLDLGEIFLEREEFEIFRGSLRLVQRLPIISNISISTALFLQRIDNKYIVVRENHGGWGYHFHYCNVKKKRSDTILSFREKLNKHGNKILFHEGHAEGKSSFRARVDLWGRQKKESAYNACLIGIGKFNLDNFKKPGASAENLWPDP